MTRSQQPPYETVAIDPAKYKWYHENLSEEDANIILRNESENSFLLRLSGSVLFLSYKLLGCTYHEEIEKNHHGFNLRGKTAIFATVPDLIAHYKKFPVRNGQTQLLGKACDQAMSGTWLIVICMHNFIAYNHYGHRRNNKKMH